MAMLWEFEDARGITMRGTVEHINDFGGSDISYRMRTLSGDCVMLRGSRLKAARTIGPAPEPA